MTISLVNTSSYQSPGSGSVHTCPISPTPTAGNKLIAVAAKAGVQSANSAGWTRIVAATDLDNIEQDIYEKWSDGTETQFQVTIATAGACIDVYEFAGMQNAASDVQAHNHSGTTATSSINTGTTSATTQDVELVVAVFNYFGSAVDTFTVPAGFTLLGHRITTNTAGNKVGMDAAFVVTATQAAQTATGTYNISRSHRGSLIATFKAATPLSAGSIYPLAKQSWLTQSPSIDVDTAVVKAAIGRASDGFSFNTAHQYFSDVSAVMVSTYSTAVTITGLSAPLGVMQSASPHIQFPISTGAALDFMVLFKDGGSAGASPLIAYVPLVAPVTPVSGQVVQVDWDTGGQTLAGILSI